MVDENYSEITKVVNKDLFKVEEVPLKFNPVKGKYNLNPSIFQSFRCSRLRLGYIVMARL